VLKTSHAIELSNYICSQLSMNPRKSIWYYFFAGIAVGAIGGGFLVYFGAMQANQDKVSVNLVPGIIRDVMDMMRKDKDQEPNENFTDSESNGTVAIHSEKNNAGSLDLSDSLDPEEAANKEDSTFLSEEDQGEIVIKRDEFIVSAPIEIINLDHKPSNKSQLKSDSLLAQNSGIKDQNKESGKEAKFKYEIEYWQSPVNYRGYRLGVNKFVFFGMDPDEPLSAYYWRGNFYLKWRDGFYLLEENESFESFEKVNQPELISLTKK
jgi:hypothetical protein